VLPAPPGAVVRRVPDLTKLRALTGHEPRVSLEEGLRRTFAWYREIEARGRPRTTSGSS
jgi:UDP-glucuronate decarboxylase